MNLITVCTEFCYPCKCMVDVQISSLENDKNTAGAAETGLHRPHTRADVFTNLCSDEHQDWVCLYYSLRHSCTVVFMVSLSWCLCLSVWLKNRKCIPLSSHSVSMENISHGHIQHTLPVHSISPPSECTLILSSLTIPQALLLFQHL